jgi:hypothetical protein
LCRIGFFNFATKEALMLGEVFERVVKKRPISVMVRASLERVLGADRLDLWFERTAQQPYTRDLLFSRVYNMMNQVVFCVQPSVRAAYRAQQDDVGASLVSLYNKLNNLETHTAAELVRYSAREFAPLIAHMGGERAPWLEGYRIKIVDGNCLEASEHRIEELRETTGRALPGKSLVVYEPAQGLVTDVFPCENGHAQERSLFGPLLKTVEAGDLWIEDRDFCTRDLLCDIDKRGAFFITREHLGLKFEILEALRECGRTETGSVAQQRVKGVDQQGQGHVFRRVRIKLKQATRDGATIVHMLTNVPRQVAGKRVADLYANAGRWKPHSNISKPIFILKSIRWATPKPHCSAFAWLWWPTTCWRWCWLRYGGFMVKRRWMKRCLCIISPTKSRRPTTA